MVLGTGNLQGMDTGPRLSLHSTNQSRSSALPMGRPGIDPYNTEGPRVLLLAKILKLGVQN